MGFNSASYTAVGKNGGYLGSAKNKKDLITNTLNQGFKRNEFNIERITEDFY